MRLGLGDRVGGVLAEIADDVLDPAAVASACVVDELVLEDLVDGGVVGLVQPVLVSATPVRVVAETMVLKLPSVMVMRSAMRSALMREIDAWRRSCAVISFPLSMAIRPTIPQKWR